MGKSLYAIRTEIEPKYIYPGEPPVARGERESERRVFGGGRRRERAGREGERWVTAVVIIAQFAS